MTRQSGIRLRAQFLALLSGATAAAVSAASPLPPSRIPEPGIIPRATVPAEVLPSRPPIRGLRDYQRSDVDAPALRRRMEGFRGGPFKLDLGARSWDLELEPSGVRAPGYAVRHLTAAGVVDQPPSPDRSFRGQVRGKPGTKVRLSIEDGRITGFVTPGDGDTYFVEPMENLRADVFPGVAGRIPHIVYRERDALSDSGVACGLESRPGSSLPPPSGSLDDQGGAADPGDLSDQTGPIGRHAIHVPPSAFALPKAGAAAEPCALVELAVAVEYSLVRGLGSAQAVEKRINDIYNMVDGMYQDPQVNIHVRISEIFIETVDKATWGASLDINQYLTSMTTWMRGANGFKNPFDVGSMWYYHLGGGTVGLAYVGVVCNNNRTNVIRYFTATTRSMVIDAAHELGHNFSAPHIANSSAIMNASITGSNDQWDASTVAKIVAHKKSRTCLSACEVAPIAAFSVSGGAQCAETRTFTDLSAGEPTAWLWEFGDGTSSNQKNPVHTYAAPGKYAVKLSASNAFGSNAAGQGDIRVKPMPAPTAVGADGCAPASLILSAQGAGTLRWYDTASGGNPLGIGAQFTTPVLTKAKTFYVENGEPDLPVTKVGPTSTAIGPGAMFNTTGDRRLFFDVHRAATLVSAKVNAATAGPRLIEILDAKKARVLAKSVQVPAGESRISLGFSLEPGTDYAIKLVGTGDSANLFRNTSGADYPYVSPDTLVTITGSDATATDTVTQAGYYYFFYDWEVRETGCASPRVAVQAKLGCTSDLAASGPVPFQAILRPLSQGRYLLEGASPKSSSLRIHIRSLDGAEVRTLTLPITAGPLSIPIDVPPTSRLLTAEIHLGELHRRIIIPPF